MPDARAGLDEFAVAQRDELAAHQPRDRRPGDERDREDDGRIDGRVIITSTNMKINGGMVWKTSVSAHQQVVDQAAVVAGERADEHARRRSPRRSP